MVEYDKCECAVCSLLVPKPEAMKIRTRSSATGRTNYDVWLCSSCYPQFLARRGKRRRAKTAAALGAVLLIYMVFLTQKDDRTRIEVATAATDTIPEIINVAGTEPSPPPKQSTENHVSSEYPPKGPADSPPKKSTDRFVSPLWPQATTDSPPKPSGDDTVRPVAPQPTAASPPKESTDAPKRTPTSPPKQSTGPPKRPADAPRPTFEGPGVTLVQNRLIELGYLKGTSNGRWDRKSSAALREFKAANGLPADEKWDDATNDRLFSAGIVRAPRPVAPSARAH
jgi:hypothetical protein